MFRVTALQAILSDRRALDETGQMFLGTYTNNAPQFFNLSQQPIDSSVSTLFIEDLQQTLGEGETHLFLDNHPDLVSVLVPIAETNWSLIITEDQSELYAPVKQKLLQLVWVVFLLSGLQTLLIFVILRPLAGQVLIHTDELKTMTHQLQAACEQSPAAIVITDANGTIEYVNPKFEELTGYSSSEVLGNNPKILKSDYTSPEDYQDLWQTITSGECWHGQFQNRKKNGELFWEAASISPIKNDLDEITHFVAVKEDITQQKAHEALLTYQANYDGLTGLPNRMLALDRLQQALVKADRDRKQVALIFLDLDHFKNINDTLGHDAGDRLLTLTAQRLQSCLRASDTVARLGGDEFLLILPGLDNLHHVEIVVSKILDTISDPLVLNAEEIMVSVSAGIAIYPNDSKSVNELRQYADAAMYVAKREGRNTFRFFTQSMNHAFQDRLRLENRLRHAVERNELHLVYQPLFDITSSRVLGAEALLRWENDELGCISPDCFIPIAEETGLISSIGLWVMQQACHDAKRWHEMGIPLWISVNLSPQQFRDPLLAETFQEVVHLNHLDPRYLEIEITERLLLEEIPGATQIIDQLHRLDFRLVIDDFGTGYSSLSYLQKYPFTTLKIDRSFIMELPESKESTSLVRATLAIAKELNIKTIAEGIETSEQLTFLQQEGCQVGQGYYFSKPLPLNDFETFIQHFSRTHPPSEVLSSMPMPHCGYTNTSSL